LSSEISLQKFHQKCELDARKSYLKNEWIEVGGLHGTVNEKQTREDSSRLHLITLFSVYIFWATQVLRRRGTVWTWGAVSRVSMCRRAPAPPNPRTFL
jgi:hypothetical protein